jgi:cysteinyl-tRNA synthetase
MCITPSASFAALWPTGSGKKLDDLRAGEPGGSRTSRESAIPLDFVLWKAAKPGEPSLGRRLGVRAGPAGISNVPRCPVWCLGEHFDIHGGGMPT